MTTDTKVRRLPGMAKVQIWAWKCERCEHVWVPRNWDEKPRVCGKCKSPYWDRPRREKAKAN